MKRTTTESNPRPTYAPWVIRTRRVLVCLIAVTVVWIGANIVGQKVSMIPKGGFALDYARNPIGLALLFGALATWTFWPKKSGEEPEHNPFLALSGPEGLLPNENDEEELLVVGTSLTYAQFLNRPSLRDVVQAQTTVETVPNVEPVHEVVRETEAEAETEAKDQPVPERSSFQKALHEQHLADWAKQATANLVNHHVDGASDANATPSEAELEPTVEQTSTPTPTFTEFCAVDDQPDAKEGQRSQTTVDDLLERWINDEADAPLPEELFASA